MTCYLQFVLSVVVPGSKDIFLNKTEFTSITMSV